MSKHIAIYVEVDTPEYHDMLKRGYKIQHRIDADEVTLAKFLIPLEG